MQAWDVISSCQGQMRLSGQGIITGFDLAAVHAVMIHKRINSPEVMDLIQAAETGMISVINDR